MFKYDRTHNLIMPKSILRRFPKCVPQKKRDTKVISEFVKQMEQVDGIPSFLRCAQAIDTHSSSIFKILKRNPDLEPFVYSKIRKKIFSLDEKIFLEKMVGRYPKRIRKFIYERLRSILVSHVMNDPEVLLITPLLKKLHVDFKMYQHLVESDPSVKDELNDLIAKRILLLSQKEFFRTVKGLTYTSPSIRFAVELGYQRFIIKEMIKTKEFRYSVVARRLGIHRKLVLRIKRKYQLFSNLLSNIKKEWFFDMIRGYRLNKINISYVKDWEYRAGDLFSDVNRFKLVSNKLFTIYHLLSYWSEKKYMLSHADYFYIMRLLNEMDINQLDKEHSFTIEVSSTERLYSELFNRFIKKIRREYGHFSPTEFLIGLYYVCLLIPYFEEDVKKVDS